MCPGETQQPAPPSARPVMNPSGSLRSRGTVLLMVIGVLALLSIFAIVYAAIGQADRRGSAALVRESDLDALAQSMADYLAGIIGQDAVAVMFRANDPAVPTAGGTLAREAVDYPSTGSWMLSQVPNAAQRALLRFNPAGSYSRPWTGPGATGPDPRFPTDPFLAATEPTWLGNSNRPAGYPPPTPQNAYLDNHDWSHISNPAPDGRFVNLVNLRGNFDAEPGFGFDARGKRRMSEQLTLFDANGLPYAAGTTQFLDDNRTIANPKIPAHWTSRQRWAFRPMSDPNRNPGAPEYLLNQWADADGSGFSNARWWEPYDATDPNNITSVIPLPSRARFFFATRTIDLSSLANVNTATEGRMAPTAVATGTPPRAYPAGSTPAEIDLRRLLTMIDFYTQYQVGYDGLPQPPAPTDASNYSGYDGPPPIGMNNAAALVGRAGYVALRSAIKAGYIPAPPPANQAADAQPLPAQARGDYYRNFGVDPQGVTRSGTSSNMMFQTPFGLAEELELRTFNGANDARRLSRLEQTLDGRLIAFPGFGPLRSNRPDSLERCPRDRLAPIDGYPDAQAMLGAAVDLRHLLTTISGARPIATTTVAVVPTNATPAQLAAAEAQASTIVPAEVRIDVPTVIGYPGPGLTDSNADVNTINTRIFKPLADCLMGLGNSNAWDHTVAAQRVRYYAYDAELVLRAACHMTINLLDAADNGDNPRAYTLVTDPTFDPVAPGWPWPQLRLPDTMLPVDPMLLRSSRAVNVYGIEAQPFLAEVTFYTFYIDTPFNALIRGDDEFSEAPPPNPPNPPVFAKVSINGSIEQTNPDFLCQVLAFQVTNPFDHDLVVTRAVDDNGDGNADPLFYVEYAGRFFQLGRQDESTGTPHVAMEEIKIKAGETRVFYTTSPQTQAKVNARFANAASSPTVPANVPPAFLDLWAKAQFGSRPGSEPVHIPMISPVTGAVTPPEVSGPLIGLMDLYGKQVTPPISSAQRKVTYLWRVLRTATEQGSAPNLQENDLLADRLRDPSTTTDGVFFGARLPAANNRIANSEAGDDHIANGDIRDNTGYCLTMWAAVRRPTPPVTGSPRGAMPPWCLEAKADTDIGAGYAQTLNAVDRGPTDIGNRAAYGTPPRYRRLDALFADQTNATSLSLDPQMRLQADMKTGNMIGTSRSIGPTGAPKPFADVAVRIALGGDLRNPTLFLRPADLLLPLAVGPSFDPSRAPTTPNRATNLEVQWTTLSEALALASDYYTPTGGTDSDPLFVGLGHSVENGPNPIPPRLDRGNLVLDAYVPFDDANNNGVYDPGERQLGAGIPAALNILDRFRTSSWGSITRMVEGLVNVNGAPIAVDRTIPLLSPTPMPGEWWWITSAQHDLRSDIASTIVAYRDRVALWPRGVTAPNQVLDFTDANNPTGGGTIFGRAYATGIVGIREQPGFASIGEILACRDLRFPAGAGYPFPHDIDRLGFDGRSIDQQGVDPVLTQVLPATVPPTYLNDGIADDYAERLAVANAALSSVSVRSDVFCVWFLVNGYLPGDVEGLAAEDPMVPSIARRYMMVVDRSNVVNKTDKPRILLFKEVPL